MSRCSSRHWFSYYGSVGSSSPVCVRCGAPNHNYRPELDDRLLQPHERESER